MSRFNPKAVGPLLIASGVTLVVTGVLFFIGYMLGRYWF